MIHGHITSLAVKKTYRKLGLATRLMKASRPTSRKSRLSPLFATHVIQRGPSRRPLQFVEAALPHPTHTERNEQGQRAAKQASREREQSSQQNSIQQGAELADSLGRT